MPRNPSEVAIAAAAATSLILGVAVAGAQPTASTASTLPKFEASSSTSSATSEPSAVDENLDVGEGLAELSRLSEEAGALGEGLHLAREELDRTSRERDRLGRAAGVAASRSALAEVAALRDQAVVDELAAMRYQGGDSGAIRAAVLATSPSDLIHRLDALRRLTGATTSALDSSRAALADASRLRQAAARAAAAADDSARDAQERNDDLARRAAEMRGRMNEVRRRVDALSDAQRARWTGGPAMQEGYVAPMVDDANSSALRVALTRLGAPYSWGATGPSEFDCSGLVVWAYSHEGKSLPRSSQAQAVAGAPVPVADIRPGDLVI